jgi:hypothetical protein
VTEVAEVGEVKEVKNRNTRRPGVGCFFSIVEIVDLQGGCELIF